MWKRGGQDQALGRSRGGLSTKVHLVTDSRGQPLRFILTGGQTNDVTQAIPLLTGLQAGYVLGDKGYDSDRVLEFIASQGARAVIPPRSHRKVQREYDRELYKQRNLIERAFNKLKHWRRIATRYDRRKVNFLAFWYLAAAIIWSV